MLWLSNRRGSLLGTRGTTYPPIDDGWWPDVRAPNFEWDAFLRRFLIPYPHQVETRIEEKINNPRGCFGDEPSKNVKSFISKFHCLGSPSCGLMERHGWGRIPQPWHLFTRDVLLRRCNPHFKFTGKPEYHLLKFGTIEIPMLGRVFPDKKYTPPLFVESSSKSLYGQVVSVLKNLHQQFKFSRGDIGGSAKSLFLKKAFLPLFRSFPRNWDLRHENKQNSDQQIHGISSVIERTSRKTRLTRAWGFATRRVCEVLSCSNAPGFPRGFHPLKFHIPHVVGRIQFSRDHHILCLTASRA